MTSQETALAELTQVLADGQIPYMIVGGVANIIWGEPRATLDIDATVWVDAPQIPLVVDWLGRRFRILVDKPADFINETRVLPLESGGGVRIDLIFGLLSFEHDAIARAETVDIAGVRLRVCTAEDLILMKIVSDRDRDLNDVRGIIRRRIAQLDRSYLEPRIRELGQLLDRPDIEERWREWSNPSS
jgi:predicted nucleotidyltransferase